MYYRSLLDCIVICVSFFPSLFEERMVRFFHTDQELIKGLQKIQNNECSLDRNQFEYNVAAHL